MRIVLQRVSEANVSINSRIKASINNGLMVLLGIEYNDDVSDIDWLVNKLINLRIFNDEDGIMNKSLRDTNGDILLISQFTLHAQTKKGNRPSYIKAANPELAIPLYEKFIQVIELELGKRIGTGEFGANMQVQLINDGPVTIIMDSKQRE